MNEFKQQIFFFVPVMRQLQLKTIQFFICALLLLRLIWELYHNKPVCVPKQVHQYPCLVFSVGEKKTPL